MFFFLSTPEYNTVQFNTTKVRVHLRNGIAEVFDKHQDLMGKVENNRIEIETNFENKLEKFSFILQDAVFIVSNKGLDGASENKETSIYVYAKRVQEITKNTSIEELSKQYEKKKADLDKEFEKVGLSDVKGAVITVSKALNSKLLLLQQEVEFLRKSLIIIKDLKS
jgi:hypothetical protein